MLLQLFSFLEVNSTKHKLVEGPTILVKNIPTKWETESKNYRYKI